MGDQSAIDLMNLVNKILKDIDNDEGDGKQVVIEEYAQSLHWWIGTLKHLGAAIAVAFKDTKTKADEMLKHQKLFVTLGYIEEGSNDYKYLIPFTEVEKAKKVQRFSGDNNKKEIKKDYSKASKED